MINKKNDPRKSMKVPDGFFEEFEDRLMENIDLEKKVKPLWSIRRLTSIAAMFIVLLSSLYLLKLNTDKNNIEFADLSLEENWDYLLDHSEEFSYEEIAAFEESEDAFREIEEELFGTIATEDLIDDFDLETIETLYK